MTPEMVVWDGLLFVGFIFLCGLAVACFEAVTNRPSNLSDPTPRGLRKAQEKKVGELFIYTYEIRGQIEKASPERKVILEEYLKVAEMKEEQERVKLEAMQVEADREKFEEMMDK